MMQTRRRGIQVRLKAPFRDFTLYSNFSHSYQISPRFLLLLLSLPRSLTRCTCCVALLPSVSRTSCGRRTSGCRAKILHSFLFLFLPFFFFFKIKSFFPLLFFSNASRLLSPCFNFIPLDIKSDIGIGTGLNNTMPNPPVNNQSELQTRAIARRERIASLIRCCPPPLLISLSHECVMRTS